MKPLLKLNDPQIFSSGLWIDTPKNQPSLWKAGENVLFSDGSIEKSKGYSIDFVSNSTDQPITGLETANANGVNRLYLGLGEYLVRIDDGVASEIGTVASDTGIWSLESFGTWLLATNNVDAPVIWKNAGGLLVWPTVPFPRARLVKKLEVFPVLFHGQEAAWPSYNNPEDFVPGPGKRAGQFFIRDLDGDIMAAEPLGDALVYYTQDMFGFMRFVGGEAAMSFKTQQAGGIGAVGPHAVVATGPFHFGLSRKGIWQSDGNSYSYIMRPKVAKWFESQINWLKALEVVGVHEEGDQRVSFFFECLDGVRRGLSYTYAGPSQGTWTILRMPVTAAATQGGNFLQVPVGLGTVQGRLNFGDNAGPAGLPASLLSAPLDVGSTDRFKRWQMLELHYELNGTLEYRVGYSNTYKGAPDWTAWDEVANQNWLQDRESVFITVELRSSAFGTSWKLTGMELYGEVVGQNR